MTWLVGTARIYRIAATGWLVLLAKGWVLETIDERYNSVLMSRAE